MNDGLSIRKILSPIIRPSRVNRADRQNSDSRGKRFKKHFDDEKDDSANEGEAKERIKQTKGEEKKGDGSGIDGQMELPKGGLGEKIDIRA